MNRHELREVKRQAIIWINDLKKSLVATTKNAQNVKQRINLIMASFNSSDLSNMITENQNIHQFNNNNSTNTNNNNHQHVSIKTKRLNNIASEILRIDNADTISLSNAGSTLDCDKYKRPRTAWQLYYTNFCRKYPLLAKTKKGKKKAKLYFNHLDHKGKKHYAEWRNWENSRTYKQNSGKSVTPRYFHRRSLTAHDFLWKGFM